MRTDDQVNALAKSWSAAPQPSDSLADGGLPCLQVAGVTVWLYRRNGRMIVSVDTDDANEDTPVYDFRGDGGVVGVTVTINGQTVFDDPDEDDLRLIRKAGG